LSMSDVKFNMPDVLASKAVEKQLVGTTAFNTRTQVEKNALNYAAAKFEGGRTVIGQDGSVSGLFVPPNLQKKHENITSAKIMSLITSRLNAIGKTELRDSTSGKFSDEVMTMLQSDIDKYFNEHMPKEAQTQQEKINKMTESAATSRLEKLKNKVKNKFVNGDPRNPNSMTYLAWKDEVAMLMVKLGLTTDLNDAKEKAFQEYQRLTKPTEGEPNPGAVPNAFQGYENLSTEDLLNIRG